MLTNSLKKYLCNLMLVLTAFLFCILAGEAILRVKQRYVNNYDFAMWNYASELKQPLWNSSLPFHHYPSRSGRYYGVEIRTNSLGFRDTERSIQKPLNTRRIIMLGDSFTLGWGVPFDKTFSYQLEAMLNKTGEMFQVINMGVGNYNTVMEVELFKLKGLKLNPDVVVLMYYINDAEQTPEINALSYSFLKYSYLLASVREQVMRYRIMRKSSGSLERYYRNLYADGAIGITATTKALTELLAICKEKNIKLLIVNIPDLRQLKEYPFVFATDYIRNFSEDNHVPFLDLLSFLEKEAGESLWVSMEDPHLNVKGNALAAEAILEKLRSIPPFSHDGAPSGESTSGLIHNRNLSNFK